MKHSTKLKKSAPSQTRPSLLQERNLGLIYALIFVIGFIFFGFVSVQLGQDNNFDLRNYHYYNPYAFVHNRTGFDYAPSQHGNFLNPISDLPFYFFATHLKPVWVGFFMGGIHSLSFGLIFAIAYCFFSAVSFKARLGLSLLCAAVGVYGPTFIGELGATQNDTLINLFILAAILILVRRLAANDTLALPKGRMTLILAGFLLGIAVGLKLTFTIYAIGTAITLVLTERGWRNRFTIIGVWGLAFVLGVLVSGGYWMATMWSLYDNPLFPFYNNIFHSPYFEPIEMSDKRYLPQSTIQGLVYPFYFVSRNHYTYQALDLRDSRYAVIYILMVIYLLSLFVRWISATKQSKQRRKKGEKSQKGKLKLEPSEKFLLVFFLVSYIIWQSKFSIFRYLVPLEALSPIVAIILVRRIFQKVEMQFLSVVLAFLVIVAIVKREGYERIPWSSSTFFEVEVPKFEDPDHTVVVIAGDRPWAFLIPSFQPGVRFVRVESTLTGPNRRTQMQVEIRAILQNHQGPIYLLSRQRQLRPDMQTLESYRLFPKSIEYLPIKSRYSEPGLCLWPVVRRQG